MNGSAMATLKSGLLILLILSFALSSNLEAGAQASDAQEVPARLDCGPFSTTPKKLPAFTDELVFTYSRGVFKTERATRSKSGKELLEGSLDPLGAIRIAGRGSYEDGSSDWIYEFRGQLRRIEPTVLIGEVRNTGGLIGFRRCVIRFALPPSELLARLSPQN